MDATPLFAWRDVFVEVGAFLSSFGVLGAVGFRYGIVRSAMSAGSAGQTPGRAVLEGAASRAALVGLGGAALGFVAVVGGLVKRAEAKHLTFDEAVAAGGPTLNVQLALLALLVVAFALAWRRVSAGWPIAAVAALAYALRAVLGGRLKGLVNPLHVLGGGLWIGTLFVLVVCGLAHAMHPSVSTDDRESLVAQMVRRFSTLALFGAGLLGITGVITAWTHLKRWSSLWTTPYGYALDAKLLIVAVVAGLGAWNWRRVGPALGADGGARAIRKTASTELVFAAVVLVLTGMLVSIPGPK